VKQLSEAEVRAMLRQDEDSVIALFMQLQEQIRQLIEQAARLERQLGMNSQNSSKPPSSDGFKRPTPKSLRKKSGRRSGGQVGHAGNTLEIVANPEHIEEHWPSQCAGCGRKLGRQHATDYEARQVHDLPLIKIEVTEHRAIEVCCSGCGQTTAGRFPAQVKPGAQYGSGMTSIGVYLTAYQLLPVERACEAMQDLFGGGPSEGTLLNMRTKAAQLLAPINAGIKAAILKSKVGNFDETGLRVQTKLWWLHSASTAELTSYAIDPKRGVEAMLRMGVLAEFQGVMVHDAFSSYGQFKGTHALCNAHLLRELTAQQELLTSEFWPSRLTTLLVMIKDAVAEAKTRGCRALDPEVARNLERDYDVQVHLGLRLHPREPKLPGKRGRPKASATTNLLERMRDRKVDILRFMVNFDVPFDNNLAERDLRMMKVKQKVSGCFRSEAGAQAFAAVRGYVSTVRKQHHRVLYALRQLFNGTPVSLRLA
jgi:transposase